MSTKENNRITSSGNARMKEIRVLSSRARERREKGLMVAEGERLVREVPSERLEATYCSESFAAAPGHAELLEKLHPVLVSDAVFAGISETRSPQGILAVVRQKKYELTDLFEGGGPLLILEDIQDPGNLGTMFRTGEGAGIGGLILSRDTADPTSPKTVRSTMGSVFRVPYLVAEDLSAAAEEVRRRGGRIYAAHLQGTREYTEVMYPALCAFLIGNEGNGLTEQTAALADERIRIPMEGQVESLNAAVAASLLVYEVHRQRRGKN